MNKRITLLSVACIFLSAVLFACGDDDSSNPVVNDDPVSSEEVELSSGSPSSSTDASSTESSSAPSSKSSSSEASSGDESSSSAGSSKAGENSSSSCSANQAGSSVSSSGSSSDSKPSSSSVSDKSSSSGGSNGVTRCKTEKADNCEYGTMVDSRDGQEYKTVKIGDQWWMAENLSYKSEFSRCYAGRDANCWKYGRLYTWAAAMDSAGEFGTNGWGCGKFGYYCSPTPPVRGMCPEGWHLPDTTEFATLFKAIGGTDYAAFKLKSDTAWKGILEGADSYGFGVLPAGYSFEVGEDYALDTIAYLWTSTAKSDYEAYLIMFGEKPSVLVKDYYANYAGSVRCIKDADGATSSSSIKSSSSVKLSFDASEGWTTDAPRDAYLNPSVKYDSIVDSRDGQVYKTVTINNQVWMAQNLNYTDSVKTPSLLGQNWCFEDKPEYCNVAGRLYTWAAAIDSVKLATDGTNPLTCGLGVKCTLPEKVRGICPEGFHLPGERELQDMFNYLGGKLKAGKVLKSKTAWNGRDSFGFAGLPAGERIMNGNEVHYYYSGQSAFFWSSLANEEGRAYRINLESSAEYVHFGPYDKTFGQSIRCLKD